MKLCFVILTIFLAVFAQPAMAQQAIPPLTKDQVMDLVKAGMGSPELVKLIQEHGVGFDLTDDYLQGLRGAGAQEQVIQALGAAARPKPLNKEQVLRLVAGGVPSRRAVILVQQRGIDFAADQHYLETLRLAGADDELIAALREASKAVQADLVVETTPGADVYLDGLLQGKASAQGELALKVRSGAHALRVSSDGKKDFEQGILLAAGQTTKIEARLAPTTGDLAVVTLPGAQVYLDGELQGTAGAQGEIDLKPRPGAHAVKVSLKGKKDFEQTVIIAAGQGSRIEARLEDMGPTPGQARTNPKDALNYVWIPAGTFTMGCSGESRDCLRDEMPAHPVTLTKGFWLGQTEVTVSAYKRFAAATGRQMPPAHRYNSDWQEENKPMMNMAWEDAHDYCTWAGGRLPSEAEWEYAARGGSTGLRYGDIDAVAWYFRDSHNRPHDVAQLRPNAFGLYDVLGNVGEWVNDWYDPEYYQHSPAEDPPGPPEGKMHMIRGSSWIDDTGALRVQNRNNFVHDMAWKNVYRGCRCAWEAVGP